MNIPRLVLPLPPTDNNCRIPILVFCPPYKYRGKMVNVRPEIIKSQEYRDWEILAEQAWRDYLRLLRADGHLVNLGELDEPSDKIRFEYNYWLFKKSNNADDQTYEKATKDFLSKKLYLDDRFVKLNLIHSQVEIDKNNPKIEIDLQAIQHYKKNKEKRQIKIENISNNE